MRQARGFEAWRKIAMAEPPASPHQDDDVAVGGGGDASATEEASANSDPSDSLGGAATNIPAADDSNNSGKNVESVKEGADTEPAQSGRSEGVSGWHKQVGQHIGSGSVRRAADTGSSSGGSSSPSEAKPQGGGTQLEQRPKWDDRVKVEHHDEVFLEDRSSLDEQPAGNAASSRSPSGSPTGAASGARKRQHAGGKSPRVDHVANWKSEVGQHLGSGSAGKQEKDKDLAASEEKIEASEKVPESRTRDGALQDRDEGVADADVDSSENLEATTLVASVPARSAVKESKSTPQSETKDQSNASAEGPDQLHDQTSEADGGGVNGNEQSSSSNQNISSTTTTSSSGVSVRQLVSSPLLSTDTPRPVFVVVGDSAGMTHAAHRRFHNVFKSGVLQAALHTGAFVVDATDDPFHTGVLHGLFMGLKPRQVDGSGDSATGPQASPMVKICVRDGPAAASGAGNVSGPPVVEVTHGGAEFSRALLDIVRKLSTPPAPAADSIFPADPPCEVVVLLFSNPVTAGNKRWQATSPTLCALRALTPRHSHRQLPLVDFRTKSERTGAPKRIAGAVTQFEETFDFEPRKGRTPEKVAASLHIITSVPFLRSRMK